MPEPTARNRKARDPRSTSLGPTRKQCVYEKTCGGRSATLFGGMLRRAGLIGDIHCEVVRLKRVFEHFRSHGVDSVLAVGDLADGYGDLSETCALLRAEGAWVVAGNHDRWLLAGEMRDLPDATRLETVTPEARRYLAALPKTRLLESPRGAVLLCHGLGEDDMASVKPDDDCEALRGNAAFLKLHSQRPARFVINGHSHRPMLRTVDGLTIVNAGTLHHLDRSVCSIVDFDAGEVQFYDIRSSAITPAECWSFERGSRPMQSLAE
jgi:predicted phosphodiesterase